MLLAEKNYFWCESLRSYYANLFCEKAWKSIEKNTDSIDNATDAFLLNLEYYISLFPWHEKAVLLAMPLVLKKRGKVKLKLFYNQLSKMWFEEYDIEMTNDIKKLFISLMV